MSCLVTRPPMPDPAICAMSTLCSCAMRRTSGDDFCRRRSSVRLAGGVAIAGVAAAVAAAVPSPCACVGAGAAVRLRLRRRRASARRRRCGRRRARRSPAASPRLRRSCATTLLTATVSPSLTVISVSTPAAGDGISASTLSVEISNSGSSRSTGVADLLDPADDRPFRDRLAHLGHHDGCGIASVRLRSGSPLTDGSKPIGPLTCESPRRARRAPLRPPPPRTSGARGSS